MRIVWIKLSFAKYSDSLFELKAQAIYTAMDGNVYFTKPNPPLDELDKAIKAYSEALVAAASGDRYEIAEKNKFRKDLEAVLQNLGRYVIMTAGDNRTMLISSGFDVRKDPESTTLDTPHLVSLATGKNPGEVMVKVNGTDARSFVYEYTTDPLTDASIWRQEVSTRKNHVLAGLKPSGKIWVRVTAVGPRGTKATSVAVSYIVQ